MGLLDEYLFLYCIVVGWDFFIPGCVQSNNYPKSTLYSTFSDKINYLKEKKHTCMIKFERINIIDSYAW